MQWNGLDECIAKDHPYYQCDVLCLECGMEIKPEETIEYLTCNTKIGPIVGHLKCCPKN